MSYTGENNQVAVNYTELVLKSATPSNDKLFEFTYESLRNIELFHNLIGKIMLP